MKYNFKGILKASAVISFSELLKITNDTIARKHFHTAAHNRNLQFFHIEFTAIQAIRFLYDSENVMWPSLREKTIIACRRDIYEGRRCN